jgi:hypothetical protein
MRSITSAQALASVRARALPPSADAVRASEVDQLQRNGYVVTDAAWGRIQPWRCAEEVGRLGQNKGMAVFQWLDSVAKDLEVHAGQRRMLVLGDMGKIVRLRELVEEADAKGIRLPAGLPMRKEGRMLAFSIKALSTWEAPAQGVEAWEEAAGPSTAEGAGASAEDSTMADRVKQRSKAAKAVGVAAAAAPLSEEENEKEAWLKFSPKQLDLVSVRGAGLAQD